MLFCVLLRYTTLGALGHQWAMKPAMKAALQAKYGVALELFASSINAQSPYFCSLFHDVERAFGSLGSFAHVSLLQGAAVANPPYDEAMLAVLSTWSLEQARRGTEAGESVALFVGMPDWGKYAHFEALERLRASGFCAHSRVIPARAVEWVDYFSGQRKRIPAHWLIAIGSDAARHALLRSAEIDDLIDRVWIGTRR
jgi:phosphorylated CTD-interacting factor 1